MGSLGRIGPFRPHDASWTLDAFLRRIDTGRFRSRGYLSPRQPVDIEGVIRRGTPVTNDDAALIVAHTTGADMPRDTLIRLQAVWWALSWAAIEIPEGQETIMQILFEIQALPPDFGLPPGGWIDKHFLKARTTWERLPGWSFRWAQVYDECYRKFTTGSLPADRWANANRFMGRLMACGYPALYPSHAALAIAEIVIFTTLEGYSPYFIPRHFFAAAELLKMAASVYYNFCESMEPDTGVAATTRSTGWLTKSNPDYIDPGLVFRLEGKYTIGMWAYWILSWEFYDTDVRYPPEVHITAIEVVRAMHNASGGVSGLTDGPPTPASGGDEFIGWEDAGIKQAVSDSNQDTISEET
ncbi:hypothetical protein F5Y10DRAFT_221266 [Nemania abortiva]|nr:hypothetical protein F5Y10DRAFT_221266 [Nemania abortiva]